MSFALPFELPQQLSVRTKLHLNFQNSYRFQQYTVASALHVDGINGGSLVLLYCFATTCIYHYITDFAYYLSTLVY